MTSVEMCPKQAVIGGREGCQPDTWDYSEGLQLVYTSRGQSETVILSGDMDLHQRHAASSAWQNCEKEECFQIVSCFFFSSSVHETTTLVKICVLLQLLVTRWERGTLACNNRQIQFTETQIRQSVG